MATDGTSLIKDGWFMEKGPLWPGQAMSLEVESVLHHSKSTFQDITVVQTKAYGKVLILDGVIQCTERDENAYHEMIVHIPLYTHPNPKTVLVIGGGDGGAMREILKHNIQSAILCEIDSAVTTTAQEFFPNMADALSNSCVTIHVADGNDFLTNHENAFDVIIADTSDPIGPAEALFRKHFYQLAAAALRPGGLLCAQGECLWLHGHIIGPLLASCRKIFPVVQYAYTTIPTYPSGQIGFVLCAKDAATDFSNPVREPLDEVQAGLRYYNRDIHKASFVLPQFAKKLVAGDGNAP